MLAELRGACAEVAARARHVRIHPDGIPAYAVALPPAGELRAAVVNSAAREQAAAFWLTLAAVNFGSGWFPTLRKRPGRSGYDTIAAAVRARFEARGAWSAEQLCEIEPAELAALTSQDPRHELMVLFAVSLRDLGTHIGAEFDDSFEAPVRQAGASALALVDTLAGWSCFADVSRYAGLELPFLKRAQLAAADLARAGVAPFADLAQLTMFADNLVPHVLRLDGILSFDDRLVARIERGELIEHGSEEEVEVRACALHAVELIVAAAPGMTAAQVDELLWNRGRQPRYKASPRHRSRCTAY
jgi:hypothetical protein